jgi:hypothetical protein
MIKLICGIFITSYSLMFWIIHLNLIVVGKEIRDYFLYCFTHIETLIVFVGIYLITSVVLKINGKK